ncbi:PH domain-containing protein [Brevibacillus thermoruber]|uniref:PH domain-containing protein n=1 Tax=Brevibacillus thermoruber TaxID=33942 RepID=UPI0012DFEC53|nr:PH domain-containing protein [Brevibacillus thermoruber]
MRFPSRVDRWLAVVIWGTMLLVILEGVQSLFTGTLGTTERIALFFIHFVLPCFLLWLVTSVCYIIENDALIIQYGPFKKIIPLDSINRVRKTSNPLASPALSLKRLEIVYNHQKTVLISPKDREAFMRLLQKRCPHAVMEW